MESDESVDAQVRHKIMISVDHRGFHLAHFGTVSAELLWLQELKLWDSWTSTSADGTRNTPNSAEIREILSRSAEEGEGNLGNWKWKSREATLFQMSSSRVRSPLRSLA